MKINKNSLSFTHSPLGKRKNYQAPDIWMGKSQLIKMICQSSGSGSGNMGDGGNANEDHRFWDDEDDSPNIWDKEE